MYPIKVGNVVLIPCPSLEGTFNIGEHFLIVVEVNLGLGFVDAIYTTSLKNGESGGKYQFLPEERAAAKFPKESRFDPSRRIRYPLDELLTLGKVTGHLSNRLNQRLRDAVIKAKARPVMFDSRLPLKR